MNFLAHLWLAERTGTSLPGSILGDVVRGSDLSAYPPAIQLGIRLHRRVDALTDRHPLIVAARNEFPEGARRYAGIVLDLAADHALTRRWNDLDTPPLDAFCTHCGQAVAQAAPWFEHAGSPAPRAAGFTELLRGNATPAGIERAIRRVASRLREPDRLLDSARHWEAASARLEPDLPRLLDDLVDAMRVFVAGGGGRSQNGNEAQPQQQAQRPER